MAGSLRIAHVDVEDYLAGERHAEIRHEYVDGELFAMTGASRTHNRLSMNLSSRLAVHLEGGPCRVAASDMKVRPATARRFYYPDLVVSCNDPRGGRRRVRRDPPDDRRRDPVRHDRADRSTREAASPTRASRRSASTCSSRSAARARSSVYHRDGGGLAARRLRCGRAHDARVDRLPARRRRPVPRPGRDRAGSARRSRPVPTRDRFHARSPAAFERGTNAPREFADVENRDRPTRGHRAPRRAAEPPRVTRR